MKRHIELFVMLAVSLFAAGCGSSQAASEPTETESAAVSVGEKNTMTITMGDKAYEVILDDNKTTQDIMSHAPLDLSLVRYAGHEYYSELPFTPVFDETRTSEIKAGHVYYWDGWNAFVINYIDWDITPYKVVHIGEIVDKSVTDYLSNAEEHVAVTVN